MSLTSSNTPLKPHHATSPSFHPFKPFLMLNLRLAAVAFASHSGGRRLFFPVLNNLYSHRKIKPNVPEMRLKCQPHRGMPSEEEREREWQRLLSTHPTPVSPSGGNELFVLNGRVNLLLSCHKETMGVHNMMQICYSMFHISYRVRRQ